jgi:hypothetical protein
LSPAQRQTTKGSSNEPKEKTRGRGKVAFICVFFGPSGGDSNNKCLFPSETGIEKLLHSTLIITSYSRIQLKAQTLGEGWGIRFFNFRKCGVGDLEYQLSYSILQYTALSAIVLGFQLSGHV